MAVCFDQWTLLPHKPLEKLSSQVWRLEGTLNDRVQRIMTLVRLSDGRIVMHNAIALEEELMKEIDAWGEVSAILIPNAFHRMDSRIMQRRYPNAKVYAPAGAIKAASKATTIHGSFSDVPQDSSVKVRHLLGVKDREGIIEVEDDAGLTLIFNDTLLNMTKKGFPMELLVGPSGTLSIPRFARWFFASDKQALRNDFNTLAARSPKRIIPGHGADVTEDTVGRMKVAADLL